ncbi:MAG: exosortase F system-associated protein [Flavobacterium sp.]|jgi:exosortase F-associated protein|uniref:exosortase F system-associated membrane protein n=1 Tax=Flavobacterium sp. TaxID=239 RepID=UPI0025BC0040|nr:exosortase F system-associated protein [Flavobacterium sp.]MCA1966541.1 exosortase F system-associated protein [Flavobacterium sp.]
MLKKLFKHKFRILVLVIALLGLIFVRAFENQLFYDPFLAFFKSEYQNKSLPSFESIPLFFGLCFRYFINTLLSLIILYSLFKQLPLVRFAMLLYGVFFVVLMVLFFGLLYFSDQPDYLILFYIRRFLIQPLFLVLFIPAFYYQQISR